MKILLLIIYDMDDWFSTAICFALAKSGKLLIFNFPSEVYLTSLEKDVQKKNKIKQKQNKTKQKNKTKNKNKQKNKQTKQNKTNALEYLKWISS